MSNSPASQVKRYMRLSPSNGSGTFSFTNGNPIIRFSVADTNAFLMGKHMRFCGNLKILRTTGTATDFNQGCNIDRVSGVQSVIQSISIGSRRYSANVLEVVHNYPRLAAQLYANTHSPKGMRTQTFNEQGAVGKGRYNKNHLGTLGTSGNLNKADRVLTSARKSAIAKDGQMGTNGFDFALRLNTGLLMNEAIPLNLLGGLEITINLAPNFASMYGSEVDANCSYTIEKPYLITPLLYMTDMEIAGYNKQAQGSFSFMSYQSLYSVLNSTDQSIVHRLNSRNLQSVLQSYIPVKYLNNIHYNQMALWDGGAVNAVEYHKDGVRYPLEYSINVRSTNGDGTNENEDLQKVDTNPQILWNAQTAIKSVKDINRSQVVPENLLGQTKQDGVWGTGLSWDMVSGSGINVAGTLTYDLKSKLQDPVNKDLANATTPATANPNHTLTTPYAQYSFYLARQNLMINKGQGILVM